MSYTVRFTNISLIDLKKLTSENRARVLKKIRWLVANFEFLMPKTLQGEFSGSFRLRAGDYRIIYSFDSEMKVVEVLRVGHRRDIYQ